MRGYRRPQHLAGVSRPYDHGRDQDDGSEQQTDYEHKQPDE